LLLSRADAVTATSICRFASEFLLWTDLGRIEFRVPSGLLTLTNEHIIPAGQFLRHFRETSTMGFKLERLHIWSGEIADQAGGMAAKLAPLAQAGANLEFISTRRQPDQPGTGVIYIAPVTGPAQVRVARSAGLVEAHDPVVMRVEGDNEAGLAYRLTQQWALAGINLQGLSMAVVERKFIGFAAFDSVTDANRAAQILADLSAAS